VWRHALDGNAGTAAVLTFLAVASHGVLDVFLPIHFAPPRDRM
jgi:hypothetical protein